MDSKYRISTVTGKEIKQEQRKRNKWEMTCRERQLCEELTFFHCNPKNSVYIPFFYYWISKRGQFILKDKFRQKEWDVKTFCNQLFIQSETCTLSIRHHFCLLDRSQSNSLIMFYEVQQQYLFFDQIYQTVLREKRRGQKNWERRACCDPSVSGCYSLTQEAVVTDMACFPQERVALGWIQSVEGREPSC